MNLSLREPWLNIHMPGCNTEPLGISSRSYLPPLLNVYGMKTCARVHTCTCVQHSEHMWRHVRCLLYSPPPPLLSFKEKALCWSASTAGMGRHCSRSLRGGQSQEDRAVGPSSEQLQVQSAKSLPYTGGEYTLPSSGLPGGHLKCVTHGWNYSCLLFFQEVTQ